MKFKDYYRIMDVAPDASADDIKTAYRKLARKYHPDVNKAASAQQSFTDLGEANEVLKDPAKRAAYDRMRAGGWKDGQDIETPPPPQDFSQFSDTEDGSADHFSDFFQSLFGRGSPRGRHGGFGRTAFHQRGEDIHYQLEISVEESYHGGKRDIRLQTPSIGEHGHVEAKERRLTVTIPKGVLPGTHLRLRGQGQPGESSELNGDLYLRSPSRRIIFTASTARTCPSTSPSPPGRPCSVPRCRCRRSVVRWWPPSPPIRRTAKSSGSRAAACRVIRPATSTSA